MRGVHRIQRESLKNTYPLEPCPAWALTVHLQNGTLVELYSNTACGFQPSAKILESFQDASSEWRKPLEAIEAQHQRRKRAQQQLQLQDAAPGGAQPSKRHHAAQMQPALVRPWPFAACVYAWGTLRTWP